MNKNIIKEKEIKGLQVSKIFSSDSTETLLITLEKDKLFPTHTSPRTTLLVVLEGKIDFHIENKTITLAEHQTYSFEKDIAHHVTAHEDSKFLIIR
ncbi:cupin domain-containing protein [Aureibaculum sp. 2210JD6-5]|uniref:cupin domain-containing protein n=1 Tax=Aureibaculum sp. 2210JD6-5 TaxID=3103957 RepID=UPI002AAEBAC2|nr:cupin domain-containing protein [Aureibaculum sp. 2210JD6-5]MDY7396682.1 cupin domain-containing protein [Aureibaculum sp. 2210JD6-5]